MWNRTETMPRAGDRTPGALPTGARQAGQSWAPTSPLAVVVLPAPAAGAWSAGAVGPSSHEPHASRGSRDGGCFAHLPPSHPAPCVGSHTWGQHFRPPSSKEGAGLGAGHWHKCQLAHSLYWDQSPGTWELLGENVLNEPRRRRQRLKDSRTHPRNKRRRLSGAERRAR